MKQKKLIPFVLSLTLLATGCNNNTQPTDNTATNEAESLVINGIDHIGVREYTTLTCSYLGKVISPQWTSSNKKIATVSTTGMVKGLSLGDVKITATYNGMSKDFSLAVTESWALPTVVERIKKNSYHVVVKGDGNFYDYLENPTYTMDVYSNGVIYQSHDDTADHEYFIPDYGVGIDTKKQYFNFAINADESFSNAMYFRDQSLSLDSRYYGLQILPSNYYQIDLREDNKYDMSSVSTSAYLKALYFFIGTQFVSVEQKDVMTELKDSILSLEFEVKGTNEFVATMSFGTTDTNGEKNISTTISMDFTSLEEKTSPMIDSYLKTNTPAFPEVYQEIKDVYALAKNHNYTRDLLNYTKGDGSKIHIGQSYFTDQYVSIEYNPEYIEETKEAYETPLTSHGYVDIHNKVGYTDGSYAFTIVDNKVVLGEKQINTDNLRYYSHWYDYYENLTLILDMLQDDFYMFDKITTGENTLGGVEFGTYSTIASSITSQLFSDYIEALSGLTSAGMLLTIDYSKERPSNTIVNIGGLFTYNSQLTYQYSKYPYSNFNNSKSDILDNFLASLQDK